MAERRAVATVVTNFVRFQQGGRPFDAVWADVEPMVKEFARRGLAKLDVRGPGGVDPWALDDVVQQTAVRLAELGRPGATGRFKPAKAAPGISGFRGWLWTVVSSQAVTWWRKNRGGRSLRIALESAMPWNNPPSGDESASLLDRQLAKIERPDLLPLLNDVIGKLPDELRRLVRLRLDEELSHRQSAARVGSSAPVVGRRLQDAYAILRALLEDRGFDIDAWLAA